MTGIDDQAIARRLEAAAAETAWPATPDLRSAVVARITGADAPPAPDLRDGVLGRIRARPAGRTLRPLLLAVALALAVAGLAVGLGFRLPGVEIERVAVTPSAGAGVDLGSPIPVAEALAATEPRVRVPASLPMPDGAWTQDADGEPIGGGVEGGRVQRDVRASRTGVGGCGGGALGLRIDGDRGRRRRHAGRLTGDLSALTGEPVVGSGYVTVATRARSQSGGTSCRTRLTRARPTA